jgi:predicted ATPase/class 3 adenylate cyclase/GGDEF domain-containing protein
MVAEPSASRSLPSGTVTFLRTDVERSMSLISALGREWDAVNGTHMGMVRRAIDAHGGIVVRTEGDAIFAVFPEARAGVAAAIEAQRTLMSHPWPKGVDLRVRMGLHSGEAYLAGDDYGGFEVNRAARIAASGHGGQIVVSEATRALVAEALPDGVRIRDLGRHALRDLPRPESIHQLVVSGLPSEFPPLRSLAGTTGNLPDRLTSFVGREADLAALQRLLSDGRLVTLTGPGGIGKTSTAIELARATAGAFRDGTWLVELDDVVDPGLVRGLIARTLGLFDGPERSASDALHPYLSDRSMLLVLDNFEHLLDAAGEVEAILRASPSTKVIVTSRAPLHIAGEQEYPIGPLPTAMSTDPASQLFIERARGVRPGFDPGSEADGVTEVCRLLDGLPLGIELAAARVASLPVAAIRDRLASHLPLPGPGRRDVPDRQRTLEGTVAWSYELLAPDRQRLLQDISVFDGGFDIAQAEAVHGEGDVLEALADLVDQSLLARDLDDPIEARCRILQTIQAYALRQLRDEGREPEVRRRHAMAFLALAEASAPDLPGPRQRAIVQRLRLDHANLRSAVRWTIDAGDVDVALRLVAALWRYWQFDGHLVEARTLTDEALAMRGADLPSPARLGAVTAAAGIAYWQGHAEEATGLYAEQMDLARRLGDRVAEADATFNGIYGRFISRDADGAMVMLERARRLYEELGDERALARLGWTEGVVLMNQGRPGEARRSFEDSLPTFRASGDAWYEAMALGSLAWLAFGEGDGRTAVDSFVRSMAKSRDLGDRATLAISLEVAAIAALELDEPESAALLLGALETATAQYGVQPPAGLAFLIATREPRKRIEEALDPSTLRDAMERGRRTSLDDAVELMLQLGHDAGLGPSAPSETMG